MATDCDVAVIGAGPAGLTAGIYLARAGLKAVIIEKLAPGGQAATTDVVENYPGFPEPVGGFDLTEAMRRQAKKLGALIRTAEVTGVARASDRGEKVVQLAGSSLRCSAVIVATGARHAKLGIPGEERFWGKGISCCATCDGMFYEGKRVVVVGGGDTAIKEALFLTKFAEKITIVHRRDRLRAAKALQERIFAAADQVTFAWSTVVEEILGGEHVEGVRVRDVKTGGKRTLECDGVFIFVGFTPNTESLRGVLKLDERGYVVTDETMATSVRGVYAAGDCRKRPFRQIVTACGEGAVAAHSVEGFLDKVVPEVTDTDFAEIACRGLCLVSVWSAASAHARMQVPMIERLAQRLAERATFCRLNLDAGPQTAERYSIKSCPMLLILRDGEEVHRLVGVRGEKEITEAVEEACTPVGSGGN
jgi:thioredoxin reductase (NADPH)